MAKVTIHDVARLAGVSHTTVSWVMHDDPRITRETKDKVLAVVRELDYRPNLTARSLSSGKSGSIAVFAAFLSTVFELEVMRGVEEGLDEHGNDLGVNLFLTRGDAGRKDAQLRAVLSGSRPEAVICLSLKPDDATVAEFSVAGIPLILVEESAPGAVAVKTDNVLGARLAVEHLFSRGRRRIALISGRYEGPETGLSAGERLAGYRLGLERCGLAYDPAMVLQVDRYYEEEGEAVFGKLAATGADAVFCSAGDLVAAGVLRAAKAAGVRVPEDLGLVGFDDSFVAALLSPALTTVRQPLRLMGKTAVRVAVDAALRKDTVFCPELVIRSS